MTDKKEISKQIEELLSQAQALIWEAESLADDNEVPFSMNMGGYGMGGYYDPTDREDEWGNDNGGWHASSQSC